MVLYWLMDMLGGFFEWLPSTLPVVPVPDWVADTSGWTASISDFLDGSAAWVPLRLVSIIIAAYLACLLASLALKVARIVASFLTLGGGSAA